MTGQPAEGFYLPAGLPAPRPSPDGLDTAFWEAARRGELRIQRCTGCGTFRAPEWICHRCRDFGAEWALVSGRGAVYSWERVWHPVLPALVDAVPYVAVLIELEGTGGVRLVGNLLGDPRQEIVIGDAVAAEFEHHDSYTLVQWRSEELRP